MSCIKAISLHKIYENLIKRQLFKSITNSFEFMVTTVIHLIFFGIFFFIRNIHCELKNVKFN